MFNIYAQNKPATGDSLIDWINGLLPTVVGNAPSLFNTIINILILLLALFWLWLGWTVFVDSFKRYNFNNKIYYYLILVIALILGPIGLLIYNIVRPKHSKDELDFIKVEHKFYYHQASKVVDCLYCGAYVLEGHSYCTNCGIQNRFKCGKCGALTDCDDIFCFNCGHNFGNRPNEIIKRVEDKKVREQSKNSSLDAANNKSSHNKDKNNKSSNNNPKERSQNSLKPNFITTFIDSLKKKTKELQTKFAKEEKVETKPANLKKQHHNHKKDKKRK